jgi:hypothetical protein
MDDDFDIIQKIQEKRSPKHFLWQIIKNIKWVDSINTPNVIHGELNGLIYFTYEIERHIISYNNFEIYFELNYKYKLNEEQSNQLVLTMINEHTEFDIIEINNILPCQRR